MASIQLQAAPVPIVPIPVDKITLPYTPLRFNFPVPPPLPPVLDPLPDVMRQYEQDVAKNKLQVKEAERRAKPKSRGLLGSIVNVVEEVGGQLEKGINYVSTEFENSLKSTNFESAQRNFYHFFRIPSEPLWREYMCQVINGQQWIQGNLYISDHYVGFCGEKRVHQQNYRLSFLIPWRNIISIQLGTTLKSAVQGHPPQVAINNHPNTKSDAIMFYSVDGSLHQFYAFWNLDNTYNVLDHAWRASWMDQTLGPVPIPLGQVLPPFTPIARKDRPGLAQAKQPPLLPMVTTTTTYSYPATQTTTHNPISTVTPGTAHIQTSYQPTGYPVPNADIHYTAPQTYVQPIPQGQPHGQHHEQHHGQHHEQHHPQPSAPHGQHHQIPDSGYPPGYAPQAHPQNFVQPVPQGQPHQIPDSGYPPGHGTNAQQ